MKFWISPLGYKFKRGVESERDFIRNSIMQHNQMLFMMGL